MKKTVQKIMAISFAASIIAGAQCTAAASGIQPTADTGEIIVTPRYTHIAQHQNNLSVSTSGVLSCYGKTNVYYPYVAGVTVELQKNGSTIKTWSNNRDTISAVVDETYSAVSGNTYRLRLTHTAYDSDGNLLETVVTYSDEVTY
ncbi:MAG: hypothetical protein IJ365_03150 [Clostridia bacterium]|nr:hypothetical protein [Clostridia bacterium]